MKKVEHVDNNIDIRSSVQSFNEIDQSMEIQSDLYGNGSLNFHKHDSTINTIGKDGNEITIQITINMMNGTTVHAISTLTLS